MPDANGSTRWVLAWTHFDKQDLLNTGQIKISVSTTNGMTFDPPTNLSSLSQFSINFHTESGVSLAAFDTNYAGSPLRDLVYVAFAESSDARRFDFFGQPYGLRTLISGYRPEEPSGFLLGGWMTPPSWRTYYRPQLRVNQSHLVAVTGNSEAGSGIDSTYTQSGRAMVATVPHGDFPVAWQDFYTHFSTTSSRLVSAPALAGDVDHNQMWMHYRPYNP